MDFQNLLDLLISPNYRSIFGNLLFFFLILLCIVQTFYPLFMIIAMFVRQYGLFAHFFHKVDVNSDKHGGDLIAQVLKDHNIENVFTLSGGHISPILTGAEKIGIRVVDVRHEANAVFAADAAARLTGIPGVAIVTAGPGITNTITAVKNAQMAESPVVIFSGAPATLLKGRGALQDIDQMFLMKSITKWQKCIRNLRDIVPSVREAFRQSQTGTPGPVYVECPLDILYPYKIVQKEVSSMSSSKANATIFARLTNWYLDQYNKNLFAGAFEMNQETKPWPIEIPFPKKKLVDNAIELVSKAKKPLILLGSQAVLPPVGAYKLRECIESIGIPCYLASMSRGLLGPSSPLHMRHARKEALKEADLVILGGIVCDFRLGYGKVLSRKSKIIAINRNKKQLYKNKGIFWNPSIAIQGDVGQFFIELEKALGKNQLTLDSDWISNLRARDDKNDEKTNQLAKLESDKHLNPIRVLSDFDKMLPEKAILILDGGDFVGSSSYIIHPKGPLTWLDPGAFGTLGCGGGFAIGAKCVKPDHDIFIVYGDGSLGYTLIEFDTMVRHKLPVIALVGNDASWMQILREQLPMLGSSVSCNLEYTNYEKAVEGLGGKGILMNKDNYNMHSAMEKAMEYAKQGFPVLINALIGKTKFREGSISV